MPESYRYQNRDCEEEAEEEEEQEEGKQEEMAMTASHMLGNPLIFRAKNVPAPNEEDCSPEPVYHARRPHRKSRTGCGNCKRRRVKCDETRPNCRKCQIYGIDCDYSAVQGQPSRITDLSLPQDIPNAKSNFDIIKTPPLQMSLSDLDSRINQVLKLAKPSDERSGTIPTSIQSNAFKYLHHFVTTVTFEDHSSSEAIVKVMGGDMVQLAFASPHLMHALLGSAVTHLRRYSLDDKPYRVAESYLWHNALRVYKKELTSPITPHNMDSLLSTCLMLCALVYAAEDYKPADSWVFSSDPSALNWLMMQFGVKYILSYAAPYLEQSIWRKLFLFPSDEMQILADHTPGREGLHSELADLCGIDDTTTEEDNPYHYALRMLSPLLKLDSCRGSIDKLGSFPVRLLPQFTNLLLQKDAKALVILAFWLGKVCLLKHQFFHTRFSSECIAICMYLENSDDHRILKLLEFPAECCGYLLRHVREEAVFKANFDLIGLF